MQQVWDVRISIDTCLSGFLLDVTFGAIVLGSNGLEVYWGSDAATKLTSHALATGLAVFPSGFVFGGWLES